VHQQASPSNTSTSTSTSTSGYSSLPVSHQQVHSGVGASPRATTGMAGGGDANDIKVMEDDLRRMLKLNVLSN
jgi:hypothetical protein